MMANAKANAEKNRSHGRFFSFYLHICKIFCTFAPAFYVTYERDR